MLNAFYDASTFFSTHKGKLKADVQNLSVIMEVHISRNENERLNIIQVICFHFSEGVISTYHGHFGDTNLWNNMTYPYLIF